MSASRNLQPLQFPDFYHGTTKPVTGSTIEPGHPGNYDTPAEGEAYHSGSYAYATTDPGLAAEHAFGTNSSKVVKVEPIGIPRRDPLDHDFPPTQFMSRQGWKITTPDAAADMANKYLTG